MSFMSLVYFVGFVNPLLENEIIQKSKRGSHKAHKDKNCFFTTLQLSMSLIQSCGYHRYADFFAVYNYWQFINRENAVNPFTIALLSLIQLLPSVQKVQTLDDCLTNLLRISYNGYEIKKIVNPKDNTFSTIVEKGKRILICIRENEDTKGSTQIGLFPFLGKKTLQLIVQQNSGGAHCCRFWKIYDLFPQPRLIFDSTPYPIADAWEEKKIIDLNKDGIFELIHADDQFAYFDGLTFTGSPLPTVIFKYNKMSKRYIPANSSFSWYIHKELANLRNWYQEQEKNNGFINAASYVLDFMLPDLFLGRKKQAWGFFESNYAPSDKKRMKRLITERLKTDGIYRFIYFSTRNRKLQEIKAVQHGKP